MSKKKTLVTKVSTKMAKAFLKPLFEHSPQFISKKFDGFMKISEIFPDVTLATVIAEKLHRQIEDSILFEELLSILELTLDNTQGTLQIESLSGIEYLGNLKVLRTIYLENQTIDADLSCLVNLIECSMSFGQLTEIPEGLYSLKLLRRLKFKHQQLQTINGKISGLEQLTLLDVSHNNIEELPVEIGILEQLQTIILSHNPLRVLPSEIVYIDELSYLDVSFTSLVTIPEQLALCSKLHVINLDETKITSMPDAFYLEMDHTIKIIGSQFKISSKQLGIVENQLEKSNQSIHLQKIIKQSMGIAGIISTCVIFVVVATMNRKKKKSKK